MEANGSTITAGLDAIEARSIPTIGRGTGQARAGR